MIQPESLIQAWKENFGNSLPDEAYFSPGRINLIGEHIDYNGGYVMPAAISLGVTALFFANSSSSLEVFSVDFKEMIEIDLQSFEVLSGQDQWPNYVVGVLKVLKGIGRPLRGGQLLLKSDLPLGSGLSSSAAIECLMGFIMAPQYFNENRKELALLAQKAEHDYVGVKCGIMDQYAVANGLKNHAMVLDCANVEHKNIPVNLGEYQLVIMNSRHPRTLAGSKYNERLLECQQALKIIKVFDPAEHLADAHPVSLMYVEDDILFKRAKHVVNEQSRVLEAYDALSQGDLIAFGQLLTASHISLDEDYEVAGDALNLLVHYAHKFQDCLGARMTGAGFGGCCIALVKKEKTQRFIDYVGQKYEQKSGTRAEFYIAEIVDGVNQIPFIANA